MKSVVLIAMLSGIAGADEPQDSIRRGEQHNGNGQGGDPNVLAAEIALDMIGGVAEAAGLALSIAGGVQLRRHPLAIAPSLSSRGGGMQLTLAF